MVIDLPDLSDRCHFLTIDHSWREVAGEVLRRSGPRIEQPAGASRRRDQPQPKQAPSPCSTPADCPLDCSRDGYEAHEVPRS